MISQVFKVAPERLSATQRTRRVVREALDFKPVRGVCEVAQMLGVAPAEVRELEKSALKKMRARLKQYAPPR